MRSPLCPSVISPDDAFVSRLAAAKIVPVLRTATAEIALDALEQCAAAGLDVVELTVTTPQWRRALSAARTRHPELLIGVGTVLRIEEATDALEGGADFLVSPCPAPEVRDVASGRAPFIEGGMTVAELIAASSRGVAKLFPAHVGGVAYLRSLLSIAPSALIVPTGGITVDDVPAWLAAGAVAVGVGRDLFAHDDLVALLADLRTKSLSSTERFAERRITSSTDSSERTR